MGRSSGLQRLGALTATLGNLIVGDGTLWATLAKSGTDNNVLTEDSAQALDMSFQGAAGADFVQIKRNLLGASDCATAFPYDGTIPQNTEGTAISNISITPSDEANSVILIIVNLWGETDNVNNICGAGIFVDSDANAIMAAASNNDDNGKSRVLVLMDTVNSNHKTGARTYYLRAGPSTAGGNNWRLGQLSDDTVVYSATPNKGIFLVAEVVLT